MEETFWATVRSARLVPVVSLASPDEAAPVAAALAAGGLPIAEVTLRTPDAIVGLRRMAAEGSVLVGAGTVRTARQVYEAVDAGAQFLVSPCLTEALVMAAADIGVPWVPGIATASELQRAADHGVGTVKFFPAEANGGLPALKALAAPFHDMSFLPTGGITALTATAYLAHPQVVAVGGSWMVPEVIT